ncbi:sensor histidine kinase [Sciscionella sediminilitoris]|uniref:sensor histidine kinase n=1 Tax=Sciscionella sediminilitoris TaxID=1445613 RepID=UPI00068EFD3A|nr:histidine kinase [Sciscionella sp. SE31]
MTEVQQTEPPRLSVFSWVAIHALGTVIVIANLAATQETEPWLWAVYGCTVALWPVYLVLDFHESPRTWIPLALGSLVNAVVDGFAVDVTAMLFVAVFIARMTSLPTLRFSVALAVPFLAGALVAGSEAVFGELQFDHVLTVVILGIVGFGLRQYRAQAMATRELLEQTRRTQAEQARAAALDERTRIARELHDVLAHSLGALGVQLEVAEAMLTEGGDQQAITARVSRARRLAAEGLTEARSAVAALRGEVPPLAEALTEITAAHGRDHQTETDFTCTGTPRPLDAAVTVALLRAAREALTNAAKHAPGAPVAVRLAFDTDTVGLTVHDSGAGGPVGAAGGGHGLTGMAERLALAGGSLEAGPADGAEGTGWTVRVSVPDQRGEQP